MRSTTITLIAVCALFSPTALATSTSFDFGNEGWGVFFANDGVLGDFLEPAGGNPGAHLRWRMVDTFGCNFHNDSNPAYLGDYTQFSGGVKIGVDVKVDQITFFGTPVPRNLIVELVDFNDPSDPYPWTSVWYNLGAISSDQTSDWTHFEITISDPNAAALPAGWGGTGAEDPVTFEPILPAGRTFASVLANVEEIRFTTFQPGFFYGFTDFELRFDNPGVIAIPEPATLGLLLIGSALIRRRQ